jgi:hypothetical protein
MHLNNIKSSRRRHAGREAGIQLMIKRFPQLSPNLLARRPDSRHPLVGVLSWLTGLAFWAYKPCAGLN